MPMNDASPTPRTVLFLEKVFLSPIRKDPRGVEVFNLNLIRDLVAAGIAVTVGAHPSWERAIRDRAGGGAGSLDVVTAGGRGGGVYGAIKLALSLRRRRFDVLLLANVANRLVPAMAVLRAFRVASRCVLIAHREPSARCLRAQLAWPSTVLAVNGVIAQEFRDAGCSDVHVYYGITDAHRFEPSRAPKPEDRVDFCLLGHLDSAWKGSDTAMDAFRRIPPETRARCRLHLASFHEPPSSVDEGVVIYRWMPFDEMPGFLQRMDAMLVPSRDEGVMRETFSQAMVQGMLSGLPQLVGDLPVLTEKLDKGGGLVFLTADELARHMATLAADRELRQKLGAEARATAEARYIWDSGVFVGRFLFPEPAG